MKYYFIINPKAGKGKGIEKLKKEIVETGKMLNKNFEIYITKSIGDAEFYVRSKCEQNNTPATYIACGGDGTFNEILNGAYGFDKVSVGIIPLGTGNDFCRNFEDCSFTDIKAQFNGVSSPCDIMQYKGVVNGKKVIKCCANMFNIGFDCNAADMTSKLKQYPFIKGSLAYFMGILTVLIRKKGADIKIEVDGRKIHNGKLLLTAIANGCFCGGGVKSNPYAKINDGLMDINIIKDIPRRLFVPCLPLYMKGTLFETKKYTHVASTTQCKNIVVTPNVNMKLCVDGEIFDAEKMEFYIIENGINFSKPQNVKEL